MASDSKSSQDRYKMADPLHGKLIIINNEKFKATSLKERVGSEEDAKSLKKTFGQLGFQAEVFKDQTVAQMKAIMETVASTGLGGYDCLAVAILTHGEEDNFLYGSGAATDIINLDRLFEPLKTLGDGKPKLIFVQACRGHSVDEGNLIQSDSGKKGVPFSPKFPREADFLYYYATCPGYVSFRSDRGSIFIQSLCHVLDNKIGEKVEFDLLTTLTKVNLKIAKEYETSAIKPEYLGMKQMPSIVSMLLHSVVLKGLS